MDSNPLNNVDSWKEVVQQSRKPRSVGPRKSKPKKSTNQKKISQKNKKSRSVKIHTPEPEELRSGDDTSTPQRLVSVAGHPKSCLNINSSASIYILFYRELLEDLIKLD